MGRGEGLHLMFFSCTKDGGIVFIAGLLDIHDGGTETEGANEETLTHGWRQNPSQIPRKRKQMPKGAESEW
jgi:hypothetical protein